MHTKDYSGYKIGLLTVISPTDKVNTSGRIYNTVCECGNKKKIAAGTLRRAIRLNYNISCNKCPKATIQLGDPNKAALNSLYARYKNSAKSRGFIFDINKKDFINITSKDCYYCGERPKQKSRTENKEGVYVYNGIDRLDSKKGYIKNNIVPCCGVCNVMKKDFDKQTFLDHIQKIHSRFNK